MSDRLPELRRHIDLSTLVRYAGASGDFNPIHYDESYALAAGLDGVIGHGMLAMALVSEAVTDWVGDSGLVRSLSVRFTNPFRLGDVITVTGEIVGRSDGADEVRLTCTNQDGVEVIGRATATVLSGERSDHDG
jgi:acyl dehydratase